ncbi:glycosyltransferase [Oxalobacter aliiformigenes]|uniref:glycosyltransferase family 2 protein n=1 Tax=Oxalobacter aliiformigenes TaxID=2946593 RepID=UPI0022AE65D8|nr:glycosyltransferase [Oxalobacter aliiformigenes]MCZ4065890.1 glycosyltransferase [Oxalobacter aliiformigenes]WAW00256.1 glycosyltransferase [Oxalobacter aliiformigenes]
MENDLPRPLLSVIVPVYRVETYLPKCLDSLVGQTYADLEIILVDDGSPDRSGAICDEDAARDSRIVDPSGKQGAFRSAQYGAGQGDGGVRGVCRFG